MDTVLHVIFTLLALVSLFMLCVSLSIHIYLEASLDVLETLIEHAKEREREARQSGGEVVVTRHERKLIERFEARAHAFEDKARSQFPAFYSFVEWLVSRKLDKAEGKSQAS